MIRQFGSSNKVTKSGIVATKSFPEIPKEAQSAGVPANCIHIYHFYWSHKITKELRICQSNSKTDERSGKVEPKFMPVRLRKS